MFSRFTIETRLSTAEAEERLHRCRRNRRLPEQLRRYDVSGIVGAEFLPLFGATLIAIGLYPERREALRLLRDAFEATTPTVPR